MSRRPRNVLLVVGAALLLVSVAGAAAPIGTLKQFRIPTDNADKIAVLQLR